VLIQELLVRMGSSQMLMKFCFQYSKLNNPFLFFNHISALNLFPSSQTARSGLALGGSISTQSLHLPPHGETESKNAGAVRICGGEPTAVAEAGVGRAV
jgi:hypothetical protein